jgi:SAM-dependent methyltransferase
MPKTVQSSRKIHIFYSWNTQANISVWGNISMMDAELITRLNTIWNPIYPHLAQWIEQWVPQNTGQVLEIGPFSGGIINSLLARRPTLQVLITLSEENAARAIQESFGPACPILISPPAHLPLLPTFSLVVCRGAFFFLTPGIIKECRRILEPGGHAILGGGYGPDTPNDIISPIADESKDLNYRLGKKRLSRNNLETMVSEAGLENESTIIDKGGLWLQISRKP